MSLSLKVSTNGTNGTNSDKSMSNAIQETSLYDPLLQTQSIRKEISAGRQIQLITWKNYVSFIKRRRCSFCCKMCCPITFMLVMGIMGLLRPFLTQTVNCGSYYDQLYDTNNCPDIYYSQENHLSITDSFTPISFMPNLICYQCHNYVYDAMELPPCQIGIVMDETDENLKSYTDGINSIIFRDYGQGTPYNASAPYNCLDFVRDTSNVNWTNGSLLRYFSTESDLESYIRDNDYRGSDEPLVNSPLIASIVYKSVSDDGKVWDYSFRFNQSDVPDTYQNNEYKIVDVVTKDGGTLEGQSVNQYAYNGFVSLQWVIDSAITEYMVNNISDTPVANITAYTQDFAKGWFVFPYDPIQTDFYWLIMQYPFIIFAGLMFIYPVIQIINILVTEKSTKIKEGMKMMGMTSWVYWNAMYLWFIIEFMTICLIVILLGFGMDVFLYSNRFIIFIWFWLFCLSQMTFSTLISTLFDDPKTANIVGFVVYFALIGIAGVMTVMNRTQKYFFCLLAAPCFIDSINVVVQYESALSGVQWDNLHETVSQSSMEMALIMLFVDVILYSFLTWYLSNVWPSRFGQRKSPIFCLYKSFWKSSKTELHEYGKIQEREDDDNGHNEDTNRKLGQIKNYEDVSNNDNLKNKEPIIKVRNLSKTFLSVTGNNVKAVDGISLDIYPGEVFCLLGHNGAGKTTTISMLSGLLSATGGDAFINGFSVNDDMNVIRKFLGVCPQVFLIKNLSLFFCDGYRKYVNIFELYVVYIA